MQNTDNRQQELLEEIYGAELGRQCAPRLTTLIAQNPIAPRTHVSSEKDVVLIAYPDHVKTPGEAPLKTLHDFCVEYLAPNINTIHILPHYSYTSDDGFSVSDYETVNPEFGTWHDVAALGEDFHLMLDAVFNHVSASHPWFQAFLAGDPKYKEFFISLPPDTDVSMVTRPRTTPLLTPFETANGTKYVWTTFSADQIDLNFSNPEVLLAIMEVLLKYVRFGADLIRLDAIGFIWKELGTSCLHHPKAHAIIQLMREVLRTAAPWVWLVTETNVPHAENISYFGTGNDEAHMAYNFALPTLLLHTIQTENSRRLTTWATGLHTPSGTTTFFNFTASHDGIGVRGVQDILDDDELKAIYDKVVARGGKLSMKSNPDGSTSVYEMNISYFNAVSDPTGSPDTAIRQFICSQAIALSLAGIPGIYLHSIVGSENWAEGIVETGQNRSINREKLQKDALITELADSTSRRHKIYTDYMQLLALRTSEPAFSPAAPQEIVDFGDGIFAVRRTAVDQSSVVLAVHNVTSKSIVAEIPGQWNDIVSSSVVHDTLQLDPYQVAWLRATS